MTTEQITGPAVRTFDATDIDALATHRIVDGHAACDRRLLALFAESTGQPVNCRRCNR